MDPEAHPDLIFGEEFCFPVTTAYYPTLYGPTGINVPAEFYERQKVLGCDYQGLHYSGHQAEGISSMYYVVPDYGIAHSPHGPQPLPPCAVANGRFVGAQEYCPDTVERTYHQPVPTSHYQALPSEAERTIASTSHSLANTNGLFVPGVLGQTVPVASESGAPWNPTLQQTTASSMKIQDVTLVPKVQQWRSAPWKQQLASGAIVPAKLPRARLVSKQFVQMAVPSVKLSPQTNLSYNNHVSYVGSDLGKMVSAEGSQPSSNSNSYANRRRRFVSQHNKGKSKKPIGSLPTEIVVKSYTSRLRVGNPEGKIVIRTDQYNRDDFQVVYPNAKFFVIKSFDEADVHKSIKYGVWSTSSVGNQKLDSTFREAQAIASSSSTLCPVFLFFSVNESNQFCGVAEMVGPVDFHKDMDFWSQDRWIGSFPVRWHIIKNVHNSIFRTVVLRNNEYRPVTSSRDTQEIQYTPGTTMLKLFKYAKLDESLFDEFMMHEQEEARRSRKYMRFKLRRSAPHFIPARCAYGTLQPKAESVLMDGIIRETHNQTGELWYASLAGHQASWEASGNLMSNASKANALKESHCHGKQVHENVAKAMTYQQYHPPASNLKAALDGQQQYWKKVEIPSTNTHPETAASILSKAPEEYPNEGKNALMHTAPETPELTCEEQKMNVKPSSPAIDSQLSEACSKPQTGFVAIGSMLVPIALSS
ncbi:hypothetical protein ACP70R_040856 [Stipagrostis hirtigluma subsp. patula]